MGRIVNFFAPLMLLISLGLMAFVAFSSLWSAAPFAPLYGTAYTEPQKILDRQAEYHAGDAVLTQATKCTREQVSTTEVTSARRITEPSIAPVVLFTSGRVRPQGCETLKYANVLPVLPPGTWVITGTEAAGKDGRTQTIVWVTEPFEVR